MKTNKMILTLGMMFIIVCSFAAKPPVSVQKGFEQKFPGSIRVTWIKVTATVWEAFFSLNGSKSSADFLVNGTWLETEVEIKESELPVAAHDAITTICSGWAISESYKIETGQNGIIFEVDLRKGMLKKVVAFKEDGTPVTE